MWARRKDNIRNIPQSSVNFYVRQQQMWHIKRNESKIDCPKLKNCS